MADGREDPSVTARRATEIALAGDESILAILDGESLTLSTAETVTFVPEASLAVLPGPSAKR